MYRVRKRYVLLVGGAACLVYLGMLLSPWALLQQEPSRTARQHSHLIPNEPWVTAPLRPSDAKDPDERYFDYSYKMNEEIDGYVQSHQLGEEEGSRATRDPILPGHRGGHLMNPEEGGGDIFDKYKHVMNNDWDKDMESINRKVRDHPENGNLKYKWDTEIDKSRDTDNGFEENFRNIHKEDMHNHKDEVLPSEYKKKTTRAHKHAKLKSSWEIGVRADQSHERVPVTPRRRTSKHAQTWEQFTNKTNDNSPLWLYANSYGRLGNHLFIYASVFGLSRTTGRAGAVSPDNESFLLFKSISLSPRSAPKGTAIKHEQASGVYTPELAHLPAKDITVCCYLQSWKYFAKSDYLIRQEFAVRRAFRRPARQQLFAAASKYLHTLRVDSRNSGGSLTYADLTYVGVHIRRSDVIRTFHMEKGYKPATSSYLHKATEYYRSKYPHVFFIVCSDDMVWARAALNGSDLAFMEGNQEYIDLAILASCNHTIMTVGTFGWWGGWLAGGEVVYYSNWPRFGSKVAGFYNPRDYFPSSWVALGD